ncbi:hypothetical protein B7755_052180 [Streptomyces sp. NBS 14/10]|uniref:hypothetical protein n=1 Tax=Streptomyces sp. NBS 14/10 TaxID=1945643 RepID=UPI00117CDB66|nr:hypothetical protein [Streptomyces sp. NBS 14/10]KAK1176679.1 hypothetical protein B7755_052180 [Streptomyces sp. NBS 14/10]
MTSARPERLVGELPGDPARLHLHYGHGHPAVPYDFEDTLESWYVKVTYGMAGDEEWEDEVMVCGRVSVGHRHLSVSGATSVTW